MLTLQWLDQPEQVSQLTESGWRTLKLPSVPLARPVMIRLSPGTPEIVPTLQRLVNRILEHLIRIAGAPPSQPTRAVLVQPSPDANLLEVVIGDGYTTVAMNDRWQLALANEDRVWVMPLLPDLPDAYQTLPEVLQKQNITFWQGDDIEDLALTVLARAGVTSLDRRVFISYRRIDTQPIAEQLFDALGRLNYSVFLDMVSIHPAVDFQARLFEQLADKSMVVMLQSERFSQSKWTMQEVSFAIRNNLSILVVRLPGLPDSDLLMGARAGDQITLSPAEIRRHSHGPPFALKKLALRRLVELITLTHDLELVARLASMRQRTIESLNRQGLSPVFSRSDASIQLLTAEGKPRCSLLPTSRPPGILELHDASIRSASIHGDNRVVVGTIGSIPRERRQQMDWAIEGRNVQYCDLTLLDSLFERLPQEQL